ncbi:MAG: TIGR03067 domain-containing protein [Pirellulales bacterium]|nr:TIGR03067 domain-containing protein [Pirellulales bacterium]
MKRSMILALLIALTGWLLFSPVAGRTDKPKKDKENKEEKESARSPLRGPWQVVDMVSEGKATPAEDLRQTRILFTNDKLTLRAGSKLIAKMDYTIDPKAKPATIDITHEGEKSLGLYKFRDGRLQISWNEPGKKRPDKIGDKCDGDLVLRPFGRCIYVADLKTGKSKIIFDDLKFTSGGSPEWSRDGRRFAFDAWESHRGQGSRWAHLIVCDADGKNVKDMGIGAMPTWSPDGKKIGYSSYEPRGVWTMNADGTNRNRLDENGWAIEWCPKGNKVAYTVGGGNIRVHDLDKNTSEELLDTPYQYVYYGMAWSPDGKWICFKGSRDGGTDLAVVHVGGQRIGFRVLLSRDSSKDARFHNNPTWGPDSKQIIVTMIPPGEKRTQLFLVDAQGQAKPKRLDWQSQTRSYLSPAWSPDGKKLAFFAARRVPE